VDKQTRTKIEVWERILTGYCRCYADEQGNRPCDNGALCDRCMTKDVKEVYDSELKKLGIK
jgi:hypothetical protein